MGGPMPGRLYLIEYYILDVWRQGPLRDDRWHIVKGIPSPEL